MAYEKIVVIDPARKGVGDALKTVFKPVEQKKDFSDLLNRVKMAA